MRLPDRCEPQTRAITVGNAASGPLWRDSRTLLDCHANDARSLYALGSCSRSALRIIASPYALNACRTA